MLQYLVSRVDSSFIDAKAMESSDRNQAKSGPFKQEYHDFTPLQLAIVSPFSNLNTIKALFAKDANH